jgi:hypothetical protein
MEYRNALFRQTILRSTFLVAVIVYVLSYLNYQVNRFNLKLPLRSVKH